MFCVDLRTNSDYFTVHHWLVGFHNRDWQCLLRGTHSVFICIQVNFRTQKAVPWLRQYIAGLSSRIPGFDPMRVRVRFMVYKVALWQVSLAVLRFSSVSTIAPTPPIHIYLLLSAEGQTGEPSTQNKAVSGIGKHWIGKQFHIFRIWWVKVTQLRSSNLSQMRPRTRQTYAKCRDMHSCRSWHCTSRERHVQQQSTCTN